MNASARAIVDIRNRLLGDHCGVSADEVARQIGNPARWSPRWTGCPATVTGFAASRSAEPEPSELADVITGLIDPEKPSGVVADLDPRPRGAVRAKLR